MVFMQVGTYLFGTEFAADKGVDVLNQLRIELIGFSLALFGKPALPLSMVMVCTLALCAFNALTAARAVSSAFKLSNLQMMV